MTTTTIAHPVDLSELDASIQAAERKQATAQAAANAAVARRDTAAITAAWATLADAEATVTALQEAQRPKADALVEEARALCATWEAKQEAAFARAEGLLRDLLAAVEGIKRLPGERTRGRELAALKLAFVRQQQEAGAAALPEEPEWPEAPAVPLNRLAGFYQHLERLRDTNALLSARLRDRITPG